MNMIKIQAENDKQQHKKAKELKSALSKKFLPFLQIKGIQNFYLALANRGPALPVGKNFLRVPIPTFYVTQSFSPVV